MLNKICESDKQQLKQKLNSLQQSHTNAVIICTMRSFGASFQDIADVLGLTRQAVNQMARRAGIQ